MRRGQATGVTSLLYLTPPVAALVEWLGVRRRADARLMWAGMVVACIGVAMVTVTTARQDRAADRGTVLGRCRARGPGTP